MCGIVGYVGFRDATGILLEGLHRLEYRGYDSAGLAVRDDHGITLRKKAGRVAELAGLVERQPVHGSLGIAHTRWATHGEANDTNSHPHVGGNGEVVLVHNGVIENYSALRDRLQSLGYVFRTATDTEVIAHLIAHQLEELAHLGHPAEDRQTLITAVEQALRALKGTYGLAILFRDHPNLIIAARLGSPLVVGIGKGEYFLASDAGPLVGHTQQVVYLADNELAILTPDNLEIIHRDGGQRAPSIQVLDQGVGDTDLGEYEHYMLKEI
ncbi:MAG TPA: class II glutamine amidotransferase, partial [Planctomycetaceae bacterium]|nr:class II glutamine amidotransferase [Planctomycetaceae bacterium]